MKMTITAKLIKTISNMLLMDATIMGLDDVKNYSLKGTNFLKKDF